MARHWVLGPVRGCPGWGPGGYALGMVSERTAAPPTEFELPGGAWFAIGAAISFALVFWLAFGVMADITTDYPASVGGDSAAVVADASGVRAAATEFAFSLEPSHPAGLVSMTLVNEGQTFHNLEIIGLDGESMPGFVLEADPGQEATGEIELAPGTYTLFCSVPGHREAGMESTLTVTG